MNGGKNSESVKVCSAGPANAAPVEFDYVATLSGMPENGSLQ